MDNNKIRQVKTFFKNEPVEVVYLFGSQAGGRVGPMSDYDFAVLFQDKLSSDQRFNKRLKYIGFFIKLCKTDKVDVVDLNEPAIYLHFEIIKKGKPLYIHHHLPRITFEKKTMSEFYDYHYYIRRGTLRGLSFLKQQYGIT